MPIITGEVTQEEPPTVEVIRPPAESLTWLRSSSMGNYMATSSRHSFMVKRLGGPTVRDPWWQLFVDGVRTGDAVPKLTDAQAAGQDVENT